MDKWQAIFRCPLCQSDYNATERKPKFLSCNHVFCLQCLQGVAEKGERFILACPRCRKVTSLSKKGASSLNTYSDLLNCIQTNTDAGEDLDVNKTKEEENGAQISSAQELTKQWCRDCCKEADHECITSKHTACDYQTHIKRLDTRMRKLAGKVETYTKREREFKQSNVELLQSVALFVQLEIEAQEGMVTQAESNFEAAQNLWLEYEQTKYTNGTAVINAMRDNLKPIETRFEELRREMSISSSLKNFNIRVTLPNGDHFFGSDGFNVGIDGANTGEKALIYLLLKMFAGDDRGAKSSVNGEIWTKLPKTVGVTSERKGDLSNSVTESVHNLSGSARTLSESEANFCGSARNLSGSELKLSGDGPNAWRPARNLSESDANSSGFYRKLSGSAPKLSRSVANLSATASRAKSYKTTCFLDIEVNGKEFGRISIGMKAGMDQKLSKNFIELCKGSKGFGYKGSKLFNSRPNTHVVGGDFENNDGTGGRSIYEEQHFLTKGSGLVDTVGAIRMRCMGRDQVTGHLKVGSQFHIWVGPKTMFKHYTCSLVIGEVTGGLDILEKISTFRRRVDADSLYLFYNNVIIKECGVYVI